MTVFRAIRFIAPAVALLLGSAALPAATPSLVNAAPVFSGGAGQGRSVSLSSLKGRPVLLLIAPSPRDRSFRSQLSNLRGVYERLAAKGMLAFAAFTVEGGRISSNIPFLLVDRPSEVAARYDIGEGFAIAVIGVDGNLDCLSSKPLPGQRVLDIFNNNAAVQESLRH